MSTLFLRADTLVSTHTLVLSLPSLLRIYSINYLIIVLIYLKRGMGLLSCPVKEFSVNYSDLSAFWTIFFTNF
jgi:hypothetical protein